jgi:outer membrane protein assembly factor BamB
MPGASIRNPQFAITFMIRWLPLALALAMAMPALAIAAEAPVAGSTVRPGDLPGGTGGVMVLLGDKECKEAIAQAKEGGWTIYVQLASPEDVEAARRAADAAGLYGTRIFVEQGPYENIHLADNVADQLRYLAGDGKPDFKELLRVVRPGGSALALGDLRRKDFPAGVDDWSHPYHGPDNNPQSRDTVARAPYLTQFIAEPRYAPAPQSCVAAGGRVFMAFGHIAWHEREERVMNTLIALNGYNGAELWRRPLKPGIMVDRSTMVATPAALYLADDVSCKVLDAETGKVADEIVPPADLVDGTFWKWMALEDGRLFALVGQAEPADPNATWRKTSHGWPWNGISQGYNGPEFAWGFSRTLLAIDPKTKQVLWHHKEDPPMDARATCLKGGRIYICHFGKYLACLDAKTGKELWRRTAEKDPDVFAAIGPYRAGHGYVEGWKTTVYMKCTEKALYLVGPQVNWLAALSADDGRFLWKCPAKDLQAVIRDDGLYTTGPQGSKGLTQKLDPLTGSILASFDVSRRACTRSTGSIDAVFFRAGEGTVRLDLATGRPQWISPMRPSCHVGVVIAGGMLYWVPWACDCNLQVFGAIGLAPAGDFKFDRKATDAERLETHAKAPAAVAKFETSAADWPTYRADNARSGRVSAVISGKAALLWQFTPKTRFEATAPTAAGGLVFLAGSDGIVRALDAATGQARWTAYTGGAVRYPPTISAGRALVGSADGWAYAFEAAGGRLLWRFRAAPAERRIPVYGALVSTWPVSSGVIVDGGTAYFAAGINNFDGTHVVAADAATGRLMWQNNECGHLDAFSRRGVAAQGDMLISGGKLYLAGGNVASPGVFDLADGACLNSPPQGPTPAPRGRELVLVEDSAGARAGQQVQVRGQPLYSTAAAPVFDKSTEWETPIVGTKNAVLSCLLRRGTGTPVWALVARDRVGGTELWLQPLPSEPVRWGMAVDAQGRIFVTLRDGQVMAFGEKP